jgi:hypothetical protein
MEQMQALGLEKDTARTDITVRTPLMMMLLGPSGKLQPLD